MKKVIGANVFLIVSVLSAVAMAGGDEPAFGYAGLGDVDHLWQWTGKVRTAMSSSTDTTGGNMDMVYFHGRHKGEKVLARIEGPGCVYRIWAAMPSGTVKFYLDGAAEPEIKCKLKEYLEGKCADLPGDFAVGRAANYMPVCFSESALVTARGFHFPAYYQISYQTYDPSVKVTSFEKDTAMNSPGLETAKKVWRDGVVGQSGNLYSKKAVAEILPGAKMEMVDIPGSGIIRRLIVNNPDDLSDRLQGLRLRITWDGRAEPAVDVPLDAFFLNYFDLKQKWPGGSLATYFIYASAGGYVAEFPMPFSDGAKIEVVNTGSGAKKIRMTALYEQQDSLSANSMRFHAFYRNQDYETDVTRKNTFKIRKPIDPATNYVVLEREGRGHYVGCAVFVESVGTIWWGEGDEMTYIDGADKPQIQGTGTEDEFNWSWGFMPHLSPVSGTLPVVPECKQPLAAQIIPALLNPDCMTLAGENISYRFRPSDYVPFESSIKVSYEVLGISWKTPNDMLSGNLSQTRGDDYASIAYWYEMP